MIQITIRRVSIFGIFFNAQRFLIILSRLGPYFISKSVFDTYIKSCAGYCVLTYLLGVGDRHLDNLLVHPGKNILLDCFYFNPLTIYYQYFRSIDGYFFHCDFSFLFGRDPKAYIPVRFTTGMALAMGGKDSDYYSRFLSLAGAAFLTFRRQEVSFIIFVLN